MSGPVNVDLMSPAEYQLWPEVRGVIETVNAWMQPFLKLFGVKDGNGLSPLVSAKYYTVRDFHEVVERVFKTPTKDKRDSNSAG